MESWNCLCGTFLMAYSKEALHEEINRHLAGHNSEIVQPLEQYSPADYIIAHSMGISLKI